MGSFTRIFPLPSTTMSSWPALRAARACDRPGLLASCTDSPAFVARSRSSVSRDAEPATTPTRWLTAFLPCRGGDDHGGGDHDEEDDRHHPEYPPPDPLPDLTPGHQPR